MTEQDRPTSRDLDSEDEPEVESGPVTILQLARFRGVKDANGSISFGACQRCGACVTAYNACPSHTGYIMCKNGCIGDLGYETVEEANLDLFPEEYTWQGPERKAQ